MSAHRSSTRRLIGCLAVACLTAFVATATASDLPTFSDQQIEKFEKLVKKANAAYSAKKYKKAGKLFDKAGAIYDGNSGMWYNAACTYALAGKTDRAFAALERAVSNGWDSVDWAREDTDLASLHELERFVSWAEAVEQRAAENPPVWPSVDLPLASTPEAIEEQADARLEKVRAIRRVIGGQRYSAERREINAWKAASWDHIASLRADREAQAEAKVEALRIVAGGRATGREPMASEIRRRTQELRASYPSSPTIAEAILFDAQLDHHAATEVAGEDKVAQKSADTAYERELLVLASTFESGPAVESALIDLIRHNTAERTVAQRFYQRLGGLIDDADAFKERMLAEARGSYYRLEGMPEFTATTVAGKEMKRADLRGNVTLVEFWATWCAPCKKELPNLKAVYQEYRDRGFDIVGISLDDEEDADLDAFKAWCLDNGISWTQVYDGQGWDAELAVHFGVKSIPFALLLDRDVNVVAAGDDLRGELLEEQVRKAVEMTDKRASR